MSSAGLETDIDTTWTGATLKAERLCLAALTSDDPWSVLNEALCEVKWAMSQLELEE